MDAQIIPDNVVMVSFDVWQTLLLVDPRYTTERFKAFYNALSPSMDFDTFNRIARGQDLQAETTAEETGVEVSFEERVRATAKATKGSVPHEADIQTLYDQVTNAYHQYAPVLIDPSASKTLKQLGERYTLALSANSGYIKRPEIEWALQHTGIIDYFTIRIYSSDIGYTKPDMRFFHAISDGARALPEQVIHVGDNITTDVQGARAAGMHAIRYLSGAPIADILGI